MPGRFLTARLPDGSLRWACIDEMSLCTAPVVAERRFAAYLAPFVDEQQARLALLDVGADSIAAGGRGGGKRHGGR